MIYDKKWFEHRSKPMETLEDALCYVAGRLNCGDCSGCPVHLYHTGCTNSNNHNKEIARKAMKLLGADIDFSSDEKMYASINAMEGKVRTSKQSAKKGTCATCLFSQMHTSGILFCKSWHNFTHDDGFCYRYDGGKIEDKPPVDK